MALTLEMYVSEPILTEYTEVLKRPTFGFSADIVDQFMAEIRNRATIVRPRESLNLSPDPKDNMFHLRYQQNCRCNFWIDWHASVELNS